MANRGVIHTYRQFLPVTDKTPVVTLNEGATPLIEAGALAEEIGFKGRLYLKFEGANPTGSFKDRGMTVAVSKAVEDGAKTIICASTGNTLSSAAAYAAAARIKCTGLLPYGKVAAGKLAQALMYGAEIVQVRGTFDDAQSLMREIAEKYGIITVNSINPHRIQGQKTAAFEIWESLERAPDYHFIPVGNGGNITAYWMGYKEYFYGSEFFKTLTQASIDEISTFVMSVIRENTPRMMGYQAAGAAPIVRGMPIKNPRTFASAIRVGNPASWEGVVKARDESGGKIDVVTDYEIREAYRLIPRLTGIFCEPASAASVAGLAKAIKKYEDFRNSEDTVVACTLTGNGLKDPDSARRANKAPAALEANLVEVARHLKL